MDLLMNGLLLAATCFAGTYCWVLARRVRDLKSLDKGLGGAIVTLTRQVELARSTLEEARASSNGTKADLAQLVQRADTAAGQLRILMAAASQPAPTLRPSSQPAATPGPDPVAHRRPPLAAGRGDAAEERETPPPQIRLAPRLPEQAPIVLPSLDRLPTSTRPAPHLAEVPKPRLLAPIENPLRRLRPSAGRATAQPSPVAPQRESEDAILEALSALAGGR